MDRTTALKTAKADGWAKAQGGFTLISSAAGRLVEDRAFDYLLPGQPVPAGMVIDAKFRWNPNRQRYERIA